MAWTQSARNKKTKFINQFSKAELEGKIKPESKLKGKSVKGHSHTAETKKKLSDKRLEWLSKNPEKHPWKYDSKFKSEPCEALKQILRDNSILFLEEYKPLSNRSFAIDIAFPDIKVGIEVNGNQHYDSLGNLLPYYQTRHDLIESSGWKLYEIHYLKCFDPIFISNVFDIQVARNNKSFEELKQKCTSCKKDFKIQRIEFILHCGVDFSKYGWATELSNLLGITPQKTTQWVKRNMPEFYSSCFIRNSVN